nr:YkgJ family cysteine cluster protein [Desulfobacula sp.]
MLTLFPVEALSLSLAFARGTQDMKAKVTLKAEKGTCPLLIDRECVLYPARPIICRTHGYPLYMKKEGGIRIDFCPENFTGMASFPKETMLDIEHLNTLLAVINRQFVDSLEADPPFKDRIPISEALFILRT